MTYAEFWQTAAEYDAQTTFLSFSYMMRRVPAYKTLLNAGEQIIPWIILGFETHLHKVYRSELWGMHWVVILMDITKQTPIEPETVPGTQFVKWSVDDTCKAWIDWYNNTPKSI